jgi:hypothetical protein
MIAISLSAFAVVILLIFDVERTLECYRRIWTCSTNNCSHGGCGVAWVVREIKTPLTPGRGISFAKGIHVTCLSEPRAPIYPKN